MATNRKILVSVGERDVGRLKAMVGKRLMRAVTYSDGLVCLEFEGGLHLVVGGAHAGETQAGSRLPSNPEVGPKELNNPKLSAPQMRRKLGSFKLDSKLKSTKSDAR